MPRAHPEPPKYRVLVSDAPMRVILFRGFRPFDALACCYLCKLASLPWSTKRVCHLCRLRIRYYRSALNRQFNAHVARGGEAEDFAIRVSGMADLSTTSGIANHSMDSGPADISDISGPADISDVSAMANVSALAAREHVSGVREWHATEEDLREVMRDVKADMSRAERELARLEAQDRRRARPRLAGQGARGPPKRDTSSSSSGEHGSSDIDGEDPARARISADDYATLAARLRRIRTQIEYLSPIRSSVERRAFEEDMVVKRVRRDKGRWGLRGADDPMFRYL